MAEPINNYVAFADNANKLAAEAQAKYSSIQNDMIQKGIEENQIASAEDQAELQAFMDKQNVAKYQELLNAAIADSPLNRCCYDILEFKPSNGMCMMGDAMTMGECNGQRITLTGQELLDLHSLLSMTTDDGNGGQRSLTVEEAAQKLYEMGYGRDDSAQSAADSAAASETAQTQQAESTENTDEAEETNKTEGAGSSNKPAASAEDRRSSTKIGIFDTKDVSGEHDTKGLSLARSDGSQVKIIDANGDGQLNMDDYDFCGALQQFEKDMTEHTKLLDEITANLDKAKTQADKSEQEYQEIAEEHEEIKDELNYLGDNMYQARNEAERQEAWAVQYERLANAEQGNQVNFLEEMARQVQQSAANSEIDGKSTADINGYMQQLRDFQQQNASSNPALMGVDLSFSVNSPASAGITAAGAAETITEPVTEPAAEPVTEPVYQGGNTIQDTQAGTDETLENEEERRKKQQLKTEGADTE